MKKILFCYFSPEYEDYTPLDIGYILALLKKEGAGKYIFETVPLSWGKEEKTGYDPIFEDIDKISSRQPDAVFFFLENVLWSKVFALKRARRLSLLLRARLPGVFIGIQGYRLTKEHLGKLFLLGSVDCVVGSDPEGSFYDLEKILDREPVTGVAFQNDSNRPKIPGAGESKCRSAKEGAEGAELDHIPSPYLAHIFDDFLAEKQKRRGNNFRAFLYSSRGCRFGCYYCSRSVKFEKTRFFSAGRFYDELEYLFSNFAISRFFVLDDAFLFSRERLALFVGEFEKRKALNPGLASIRIYAMARSESLDEKTILLLPKMNIKWIQVGLQTINPDITHYMNRKIPTEDFQRVTSDLKKAGIKLHLDIISGLPLDNIEHFKKTVDFAVSLAPARIQLKQFYLNPGTKFYFDREKYGIETENIERDLHVPYVISTAGGVNEDYHQQADEYLRKKTADNPHLGWRIATKGWLWINGEYYQK